MVREQVNKLYLTRHGNNIDKIKQQEEKSQQLDVWRNIIRIDHQYMHTKIKGGKKTLSSTSKLDLDALVNKLGKI